MIEGLKALSAVAALDLADVRRSRWVVFCIGIYALLAAIFILVGLRESSVLGYTGAGRTLISFAHALLFLLPLLALVATGQVITRARDDGSLELLFSHPIPRWAYFSGIALVRYCALTLPLVLLMIGIGVYGRLAHGQAIPWSFVLRCAAVSAALLWAFCGLGLLVSAVAKNSTKSTIATLSIWVLGVALLDLAVAGMMLKWRINAKAVFILSALNPVQSARMALLSAADPDLSALGPIGYYLVNRIGSASLFAIGVIWPVVVGCLAWAAGLWRFYRRDAV